jgi:hypothetical protein
MASQHGQDGEKERVTLRTVLKGSLFYEVTSSFVYEVTSLKVVSC